MMKIATASPPYPLSVEDGLCWIDKLSKKAADQQATIICFPETYIPGYPGMDVNLVERTAEKLQAALDKVCVIAAKNNIAIIIPMDWYLAQGWVNLAFVVSAAGNVLGYQTKNQLDPSEDNQWQAGTDRSIFEVSGIKFGITICHEGFRYPESVRWAAVNGAQIVFHPNFTGSDTDGPVLTEWGAKDNPYYEKAQLLRAMENTIYFVTSNYAFKYPESASSVIDPGGNCIAYQAYRQPGVLVVEIDPTQATALLARRFKSALYI